MLCQKKRANEDPAPLITNTWQRLKTLSADVSLHSLATRHSGARRWNVNPN